MESLKDVPSTSPRSWGIIFASLLPLWLLSLSIMAEGFPPPPISREVAVASFITAIVAGIVLVWRGWMPIELLLCCLYPFLLLYTLDEVSTTYKTPFIILCTLILTAGAVGYQRIRSPGLRWVFLLVVTGVALLAASNAAHNFWVMAEELGYERCFPDAYGCPPLTGQETPWWILFFRLRS